MVEIPSTVSVGQCQLSSRFYHGPNGRDIPTSPKLRHVLIGDRMQCWSYGARYRGQKPLEHQQLAARTLERPDALAAMLGLIFTGSLVPGVLPNLTVTLQLHSGHLYQGAWDSLLGSIAGKLPVTEHFRLFVTLRLRIRKNLKEPARTHCTTSIGTGIWNEQHQLLMIIRTTFQMIEIILAAWSF